MTEFGDLEISGRSCGSENFMISLTTAERNEKLLKFLEFEVMVISVMGLWFVPTLAMMLLLCFEKVASFSWNSGLWILIVVCVVVEKENPGRGLVLAGAVVGVGGGDWSVVLAPELPQVFFFFE